MIRRYPIERNCVEIRRGNLRGKVANGNEYERKKREKREMGERN